MNHRVSFLILANLGLAACTSDKPAANAESAAPLTIPPMPPSASAAPPPAPAPAPTAVATVGSPDPDDDDDDDHPQIQGTPSHTCRSSVDCPHQRCVIPTGKKVGMCRPLPTRGRPLVVDGASHIAEYTRPFVPRVTSDEIARLQDAAREEHASIAAFARTTLELMALGAPTWLLAETQIALGDEIRHTERSLAMLEKLTGERPHVGRLEAATLPLARPIEDFFRDVLHGGAIGETLAATEAETRRLATTDEDLRDFYEMIVVDESRHAALAYKTLRWLIEQRPELRAILDEERGVLLDVFP